MELNNRKLKRKVNLGIEILRMILSFLIVVIHFYNRSFATSPLRSFPFKNLGFYIPTFFVISFYFSHDCFVSRNIPKIKQRFQRILIGYGIHGVFWFLFNLIFFPKQIFLNYKLFNKYAFILTSP